MDAWPRAADETGALHFAATTDAERIPDVKIAMDCQPASTGHPDHTETFGSVKSMAWAEAWDAALLMAPIWVLGSVAA